MDDGAISEHHSSCEKCFSRYKFYPEEVFRRIHPVSHGPVDGAACLQWTNIEAMKRKKRKLSNSKSSTASSNDSKTPADPSDEPQSSTGCSEIATTIAKWGR